MHYFFYSDTTQHCPVTIIQHIKHIQQYCNTFNFSFSRDKDVDQMFCFFWNLQTFIHPSWNPCQQPCRSVASNYRAAGWYQSVGHLVLGRTEKNK